MEITITAVEQLGPTVLVRARADNGAEKEVQGFDLPFDEAGYLSMLAMRFTEPDFVEQKAEKTLDLSVEIEDSPQLDPEKLAKAEAEVKTHRKFIGKKFILVDNKVNENMLLSDV